MKKLVLMLMLTAITVITLTVYSKSVMADWELLYPPIKVMDCEDGTDKSEEDIEVKFKTVEFARDIIEKLSGRMFADYQN